MSWKHIYRGNLEDEKWDACVARSTNENIYGYTWYLDVVSHMWDAFVWKDYEAVYALPVRTKLGLRYAFQPEFYQRSDLFFENETPPIDQLERLIRLRVQKINHTSSIDILGEGEEKNNYIIQLNEPRKPSQNHRRNILKSIKAELHYHRLGLDHGEEIFNVFEANTRFELSAEFPAVYHHLLSVLQEQKKLMLRVARYEGRSIAYAVVAEGRERVVLLMLATTPEAKELGASFGLINDCLEYYTGKARIFDFEGSSDEGIARFYRGFGAEPERYFYFDESLLTSTGKRLLKKN